MSMNPYDQLHFLIDALKESSEYKEMMRLRKIAYESDTNRALLDEYKKLTYHLQAKVAAGENLPEDDFKRLQQLGTILQFDTNVSAYLVADMCFQRMLGDIMKELAALANIDLDALT